MRAMVFVYTSIILCCLTVTIIAVLTMDSTYADVMQQNLEDSILQSVKMLQVDRDMREKDYQLTVGVVDGTGKDASDYGLVLPKGDISLSYQDGESLDTFKEDFIAYLTANLDSRLTSVGVQFYGADEVNGILSVKVFASYQYPTGQSGVVSCFRTVILDKVRKQ